MFTSKFSSGNDFQAYNSRQSSFHFFTEPPQCVVSVIKQPEQVEEQIEIESPISPVKRCLTPELSFESIYTNKSEKVFEYQQHVSKSDNNIVLSIIEKSEDFKEDEKEVEEKPVIKREPSLKLLVQRLMIDKK